METLLEKQLLWVEIECFEWSNVRINAVKRQEKNRIWLRNWLADGTGLMTIY